MILQERVPRRVYELTFRAEARPLKLVRAVLSMAGVDEQRWSDQFVRGIPIIKLFESNSSFAKRWLRLFQKLQLPGVTVSLRTLSPKDWLTRWKREWKPGRLTRRLDVVPLWHRRKYHRRKGRGYIVLDTLLSFGTGLHETTQIVSQMIEDQAGKFQTLLDVGTGTGILALVAYKHGARQVTAIDIGDLSVEAAKRNFAANQARAAVQRADIGRYKTSKVFDFVVANLVTHDLIAHHRKLLALVRNGGYLAVSGISLENESLVRKAFVQKPLTLLKVDKGKQWLGLLFQKKM